MIDKNASQLVDEYYRDSYSSIHTQSCLGLANERAHRKMEDERAKEHFPFTIELGAGNFEHTRHVRHSWCSYVAVDVRIPSRRVRDEYSSVIADRDFSLVAADALHLPFTSGQADRVVAGCLLLHLADPIAAIMEWQRVCSKAGVIDLLVQCDPGLATRMFRRLVSEPAARRHGVTTDQYRLVNAIDHISPFGRVLTLTQAALDPSRRLRIRYFPFPWLHSWNLNAFAVFSIEPRSDNNARSGVT